MSTHKERLEELQAALRALDVSALYLPMDDEHLNEYVVERGKRLAWLTGFTGSAGEVLLTRERCFLFVDSRYHTQATLEVEGLPIEVVKLGLSGHLPLEQRLEVLAREEAPFRLVLDPFTVSMRRFQRLSSLLERLGGSCSTLPEGFFSSRWTDAPPLPEHPYEVVPVSLAGASAEEKIARVRDALPKGAISILTKLDQIAWLLNLRGQDVPYNPVFVAYAVLYPDKVEVFTDLTKLPEEARAIPGVHFFPYEEYANALSALPAENQIVLDPDQTTQGTAALLSGRRLIERRHPAFSQKAIKNEAELRAMREANLKASRAKVRALAWLEGALSRQEKVSEHRFAEVIERFYAEEEGYRGQSFRTISAAGKNSAVVHYGNNSETEFLTPGELFLIDSGAQYLGGTTDDTRTVAIGEPTPEQRRFYSAVLRGHIALGTLTFPEDATGAQLDAVARSGVWRSQLNYGHGTGHGVGAYLNVHEGPNRIAWPIAETFQPGMITSNEPGAYREGWGGVRIENLVEVVERANIDGVRWFGFENLTFIPYDRKLIDPKELTSAELDAVDAYHAQVWEKLKDSLSDEERRWLEEACRPIER